MTAPAPDAPRRITTATKSPSERGPVRRQRTALRFDAEAGWAIEEITRAQSIMAMCDNTVAIQRRPKDTLDYLGRALAGARAMTGSRGEATETAARLLRELSAPA